jgi:hypothetical protein
MKNTLYIIIFLLTVNILTAQQMPQLSQRIINKMVFNPAAAGTVEKPEIMIQHRSQWL